MKTFQKIVEKLTQKGLKISMMESCTGGGISNSITNIEGSSEVFEFCAVTYSNDYKIKMGVSKELIDEYSVYSFEVSGDMAKAITSFTNSDYGIGVTGKLNRVDPHNLKGNNNEVFVSIYDKRNDILNSFKIVVTEESRKKNKELVINRIIEELEEMI
ncbi:MAG: CinA family protein [Bacilli bacterium]|nr:CinA family protein [Bacilli bacterium]